MQINEYLDSADFKQTMGSKANQYREKFRILIKKAGFGEHEVSDEKVHTKILRKNGFNWAGLLFGPFWAIYRKMMVGWIMLAVGVIVTVIELVGISGTFANAMNFGYSGACILLFGVQGNSLLLVELLKQHSKEQNETVSERRSWLNVGVSVGVWLLLIGVGPAVISGV